jgi:ubiquitin conjugation factor E4 B
VQPTIYKTYFLNAESRSKDDIKVNQLTLGQTLVNLQDDLFQSYNAIVRASPESREKLLAFFAEVVRRNVKRSGMRVDHRTVASDGYMMNMQGMLLRLFEPVMDVTYSKVSIHPLRLSRFPASESLS